MYSALFEGSVPAYYREVYEILCPHNEQVDKDLFIQLLLKSSLPRPTISQVKYKSSNILGTEFIVTNLQGTQLCHTVPPTLKWADPKMATYFLTLTFEEIFFACWTYVTRANLNFHDCLTFLSVMILIQST